MKYTDTHKTYDVNDGNNENKHDNKNNTNNKDNAKNNDKNNNDSTNKFSPFPSTLSNKSQNQYKNILNL